MTRTIRLDPDGTVVRHDLWPALMLAAAEIERLRAERATLFAALLHVKNWYGADCPCGDDPCPYAEQVG